METHKSAIFACHGWRNPTQRWITSAEDRCNTVIALALDMGTSAFRCPVCNTIYVIDPFCPKKCDVDESGLTTIHFNGHRIEVFRGEKAQSIRSDMSQAVRFYTPKVGGIENVFVAVTLSEPGAGESFFSNPSAQTGASAQNFSSTPTSKSNGTLSRNRTAKTGQGHRGITRKQFAVLILLSLVMFGITGTTLLLWLNL